MLKRYWLFVGDYYYPRGGMRDFVKSFDDMDEAMAHVRSGSWSRGESVIKYDPAWMWYEVLDVERSRVYRPLDGWSAVTEKE